MAGRIDRLLALLRMVSVARSTPAGEQRAASLLSRVGIVKDGWAVLFRKFANEYALGEAD